MVTIEIVINFTRVMCVRVSISCRYCIAFEVILLFQVLTVTLRVWRPVHSRVIYFEQKLHHVIWVDFDAVFTIFS